MKKFLAPFLLLFSVCVFAKAQTSIAVIPGNCGLVAVNPMQCTIDMPPETALGIDSTMQINVELTPTPTKYTGNIQWGTTYVNGKVLGGAVIYLSVLNVSTNVLTAYFVGEYVERCSYTRTGCRWIRTLTAGEVTFN
jgi:hypothetical protein